MGWEGDEVVFPGAYRACCDYDNWTTDAPNFTMHIEGVGCLSPEAADVDMTFLGGGDPRWQGAINCGTDTCNFILRCQDQFDG
jgi:hypothetical protein